MNRLQDTRWASVYWNEKFLCVITKSGRGLLGLDPEGAQHLLALDVSNEILGTAVLDSLAHSRLLTMEEFATFFDQANSKEKYEAWIADLVKRYGYTSRRTLFKNMLSCGISHYHGVITFSPSRHDRLEGWEGIDELSKVEIAANSRPAEIGVALRLAMNRCR